MSRAATSSPACGSISDPLTFTRAETFVDFPGFVVGLFHATGTLGTARPTLELAGAQGSFLEGAVFDQVTEQEGIAAVSALTGAQRAGQTLTRVDSSNLDAVLGSVDLGAAVEDQVRGAIGIGRVAWVPSQSITVNRWTGVGYVLADPQTGAQHELWRSDQSRGGKFLASRDRSDGPVAAAVIIFILTMPPDAGSVNGPCVEPAIGQASEPD